MRRLLVHSFLGTMLTLAAAACTDTITGIDAVPDAPTGLSYELEPSGDPLAPRGIVLRWNAVSAPNLGVYRVYSRASSGASFGLRGTTTSTSFHDAGQPHLEYYVTAESQGGLESDGSAVVLVDERLRLPKPATLTSVSLNAAIHLQWADNAFRADPAGFAHYRVYSTSYDLDNNVCGTSWSLEGTTVANSFLSANLTNGRPRCFGVSAVTIEGFESLWSPLRYDTPRPDGRNVIVFTAAADPARSGFRFFLDANGDGQAGPLELGLVGPASGNNLDFTVTKDVSGNLFLAPQRTNTTVTAYGTGPIADLTSIDIAPVGGYARTALQAVAMRGYVFRMNEGDGFFRYGGLRVTATGVDYVIFDWSYQTDPGNPELIRVMP